MVLVVTYQAQGEKASILNTPEPVRDGLSTAVEQQASQVEHPVDEKKNAEDEDSESSAYAKDIDELNNEDTQFDDVKPVLTRRMAAMYSLAENNEFNSTVIIR